MSGFFYNLGRHLGRKAVPAIRKTKWIWDGVAGSEEESLRAEVALGRDMASELTKTLELVPDATAQAMADDICTRLQRVVRDKRRTFQCEIFRDSFPNAMALPGGFLYLSDSLVEFCQRNPDELGFVLGHEMAHVIRRHAWDRLLNEAAFKVASAVSSRMGPLGGWLRREGLVLLRTAHSRDCEFEADELGFRLAAAAGFAPTGGIEVLQRIGRSQSHAKDLGQYLSSHPTPGDRVARLEKVKSRLLEDKPQQKPEAG